MKFPVASFFGKKSSAMSGTSGDLNEKNSECSSKLNDNSIPLKSKAAKGQNGKKGKRSSKTKKSSDICKLSCELNHNNSHLSNSESNDN